MACTAFFDVRDGEGDLYVFDAGGSRLRQSIHFTVGPDGELVIPEMPSDITEAYLSLPKENLDFRVLDLPFTDERKIRDVLPFELEGMVLGDPANLVIDAKVIAKTDGGRKVLAAYVQKSLVRRLLKSLASLGIDPRAITSLELGRAVRNSSTPDELVGVLGEKVAIEAGERHRAALQEIKERTVDFRRGEFSFMQDLQKARRSLIALAVSALALMLVFTADMAVKTAATNKQIANTEQAMVKAYSRMFPGRKQTQTQGLNYKVRSELKVLKEKNAALRGVDALGFMMKLQGLNTPGLALSSVKLEPGQVALKGTADSIGVVEGFKASLEGIMDEVKITDSGQTAQKDVLFTITAKEGVK